MYGSLGIIALTTFLYFLPVKLPYLHEFVSGIWNLLSLMWWGMLMGFIFVGLMSKIPKDYFNALLGDGNTFGGILRAAAAGLLLDLCSHGIVMVGARLYERGASLGQVMTFLIASPWNSLSLTFIMIALLGLPWTLVFIAGSAVIAVFSGVIFQILVKHKILPSNPHTEALSDGFSFLKNAKEDLKSFRLNTAFVKDVLHGGWDGAQMILKWLLLGTILAASARTFIPPESFAAWFGPTLIGLLATLVATTLIEVCSEGSTPLAAEIMHGAHAPGNAFAFLMAGVATDYTEVMVIRGFTGRWLIALSLPLVTVPQVILLGWIMNQF